MMNNQSIIARCAMIFMGIFTLTLLTLPTGLADVAPIPATASKTVPQVLQSVGTKPKWPNFSQLGIKPTVALVHPNQAVFEDKLQALLANPKPSETLPEAIFQLYKDYSVAEVSLEEKNGLFNAYYNALETAKNKLEEGAYAKPKPHENDRLPEVELLHQQQQEGAYYYGLDHKTLLDLLPKAATTPAIVYFLSLNALHDSQAPFDDAGVLVTWPQLAYTLEALQRFKQHYPTFPTPITQLELVYTNALLGRFDNTPLHEGTLTDGGEQPLRPGVREGLELYLRYCRGAASYNTVKVLYDQLKLNNFMYKASMAPETALR
jgi:hypothetical protein